MNSYRKRTNISVCQTYFTAFLYISCEVLQKASKISVHHDCKSLPFPSQMQQRLLRKEEGVKQPDLSSLTQMEKEAPAPMLGCSRVPGFQLCCSKTPSPFFPSTEPCSLARAHCSHWAVPLQLTYHSIIARHHLNQWFPSRASGRWKLTRSKRGLLAASTSLWRHLAQAEGCVTTRRCFHGTYHTQCHSFPSHTDPGPDICS